MQDLLRRVGRRLLSNRRGQNAYKALTNLLQRHVHTVLTGPGRGLKLRVGATPGYLLGFSERAVQDALVSHLRPGDVFWDVGSYIGFEALLAGRLVGPSGSVHCFEPVPENVELLRENLDANECLAHIHQFALADEEGTAHMFLGDWSIGARLSERGGVPVSTHRADSLDLAPPSLIKIDVEGAEGRVIEGMTRILEEHKPVLIVEVHGTQAEVGAQLAARGYELAHLDDRGGMPHVLALPRVLGDRSDNGAHADGRAQPDA